MASFNDFLTNSGQKMLAKMTSGSVLTFTKVVVGDGILDASADIRTVAEVINEVATLPIDSVTKSADNKVTIRAVLNNGNLEKGFYFREKGIYGTTDGTDECLIFYANNGAFAEWIDVLGTQLIEKVLRTIVTFSDGESVNITLSHSAYAPPTVISNYVTIQEFISNESEVTDMEKGSDIILGNGDIYTYIGGELADINSYLYQAGSILTEIMAAFEWHDSITVISDDTSTVRTDYDDGSSSVSKISDNGNVVVTTNYDTAGAFIEQFVTRINGNTIETKKVGGN